MYIDRDKTRQMAAFLAQEHFRYRRAKGAAPKPGETALDSRWALEIASRETPLLRRMKQDFSRFFEQCMDVRLRADSSADPIISFGLTAEPGRRAGDAPDEESFAIAVQERRIVVRARHERGLLQAAHYLERKAALRGGPFFARGRIEKTPAFSPMISQTVFCLPTEDLKYPLWASDDYLSLMSHFSVNGLFIFTHLWDFCSSPTIPELRASDYSARVAQLKRRCNRAARFGIDLYLNVSTGAFPADAPVFRKHPDLRGAPLNYGDEVQTKYNLCSSHPTVLKCYNETFENLYRDVPKLGGAIIIVGGECFLHCFTRPKPPLKKGTSCPRCAGRKASRDVAGLINGIAAAVHRAKPSARVFVWPYSAFTWSGEKDPAQEELIRHLHPDVSFLSTFETPHRHRIGAATATLIDYNLTNLGPSEQFHRQTVALARKEMRHYAKFESSIDPALFCVPYIPVHYRWAERYRRLIRENVGGVLAKWRFYGFTGSWPEELLCETNWSPTLKTDTFLLAAARRDFGPVSSRILDAWRHMSKAWAQLPMSHLFFGERQFYMKGPFYLGPAHPLIFDVQQRYGLIRNFFTLRGDAGEIFSDEELKAMENTAPPRYSSDLLFTYPFGPEAVESALDRSIREWAQGLAILDRAAGAKPNRRAVMELDTARTVLAHFRTSLNVCRFYRRRDDLFRCCGREAELSRRIAELTRILDEEIENASSILPSLERDVRLGYGHCYGQVYDADMVRDKIRQCRHVRDVELPGLKSGILFHIYAKYIVS